MVFHFDGLQSYTSGNDMINIMIHYISKCANGPWDVVALKFNES